ncbi:MAG: hypothetical protein HOW73_40085 [Polyangiaceae bacterium]|nr:hypothetical protein [Polyangiaceae bacterium]
MRFLRCAAPWRITLAFVAAGLVVGCAKTPSDEEKGKFISDDPTEATPNGGDGDSAGEGGSSAGNGGGSEGGSPAAPEPDDPERAILEADIVQIHDGRLYALSQFSGLTIIDVSNPDHLQVLGRKRLGGEPFEMYRVDNVIYAMFRSWGHYVEVDGEWQWVTSSHVEALDVADPANIESIGALEVPGWISDSRMVGDVLYTVSFENGYCWDCSVTPQTTVSSFDASSPDSIALLDQLTLEDDSYDGWTRSISVTENRIYIGGVDWSGGVGDTSTIQVVDISDPEGDLVQGAAVPVAGQILSRWQMDEHEGVFRVISQPWDSSTYPSIQTFTIASSSEMTPLGTAQITLPQPESLRSVRFDGTRAYAITAEQVDPLFTIDLSNPAAPAVRGELEIPGWVYHIEPRGDRLLALGFDNQNAEGAMNVSLFDVSNMDNPTLVKRVSFGEGWGSFGEDQDRIHKAFKILPELDLVLVPFSAWEWDDWGCSSYQSGVQIVDWANDDLVKRGVAPVRGNARRAFVYENRLFAMSDEQVRAFDFSNRDVPEKTAELQLAAHVSQVVVSGDKAVRLAADWWTNEPRLEIVDANDPTNDDAIGGLDLGAMLADVENDESCYGWSWWAVRLFAHDDAVYLVWPSYNGAEARVATVDISDPTHPTLVTHFDVPVDAYSYGGWYYYGQALVASGDTVAQVGDRLVFQQIDYPRDEYGYPIWWEEGEVKGGWLTSVDLANPLVPFFSVQPLPRGSGHTGLVAQNDRVLFSHWVPVEDQPGKARFYFDRFDVQAALPHLEEPINVPGSLVSYDETSGHLLTVDYKRKTVKTAGWMSCYETFGWGATFVPDDEDNWSDNAIGTCSAFDRLLKVVAIDEDAASAELLDAQTLDTRSYVSNLVVGDDRAFFTSIDYDYDTGESTTEVVAIGGIRDGSLTTSRKNVAETWWATPVGVSGKTLVATSYGAIVTVDATSMDNLEVTKVSDLPWWVQHVTIHDDRVLLSLGPYGLAQYEIP